MQNCHAFKAPTTLVHFVFHVKVNKQIKRYTRGPWYSAGYSIAITCPSCRGFESHWRLLCTNANSLQGQLIGTSESWGVNGHTTQCTNPVRVVGLVASAGVWLRATGNGDQHYPMGLWGLGSTLPFLWSIWRSAAVSSISSTGVGLSVVTVSKIKSAPQRTLSIE